MRWSVCGCWRNPWRACCLGFHRNQAVSPAVRTLWRACLAFAQRRHWGVISGARTLAAGVAPVGCRGARWLRTRSGQMASDPFAHGPVIHALSATAKARGITAGARVVDVQAIHPDLHVEPADPRGDIAFLDRLVQWSRRWCPWTVTDSDGILLDATGAAHLFGGEAAMLRDIVQRFAMHGLTARVAMAPTRGAAQALARHAHGTICAGDTLALTLASLPVAALRLPKDTVRLLDRLGLKTIGALTDIPRSALMRRFAHAPSDRNPLTLLDRMLGKDADPLNAPADTVQYVSRVRLAEPVIDPTPHLNALVEQLCGDLEKAEQGARHLRLTIYRVDSECRTVQFATAQATRDPLHILRLFDGKLDSIDPGFGFDLLTLAATRVEPVSRIQETLDGKRDASADVAALLDRLTARLGSQRVTWSSWTPPARFRWRGVAFQMTRYEGPERIAPEWWMDRPGTRLRDYYKVEVVDGRRFWVFRQGVTYDNRGGAPAWFMHGFFA